MIDFDRPGTYETYMCRVEAGTLDASGSDYAGTLDLVKDYNLPAPRAARPWYLHSVYSPADDVTGLEVRPGQATDPTLGGTHPEAHSRIGAVTPEGWTGHVYLTLRAADGLAFLEFVRATAAAAGVDLREPEKGLTLVPPPAAGGCC